MIRKEGIAVFLAVLIFAACSNGAGHGKVLDVTPEPEISKLTLMVYMAADNDLESYALANLKAMERAECSGIKILVLLDRAEGYDETEGNWTDTRLFEVVHDSGEGSSIKSKRLDCPALGLSVTENTELDTSKASVLRSFIEFGKTSFSSEKYALIIWGHGNGWRAVTVDDRSSGYMSVCELGKAIRGQDINVIGFDTCFGGVLENLYELKDCAEYTVACPGITPSSGWNYQNLTENLSKKDIDSQQIAKLMAESTTGSFVYKNEKLSAVFYAFEDYSKNLSILITDSESQNKVLTDLLNSKNYCYTQNPCDLYLDIFSAAEQYISGAEENLSNSAKNLKKIIEETVYSVSSEKPGIGVHLIPKSTSGAISGTHSVDYVKDSGRTDQCAFIKESQWWVPTQNGNSGSLLDKLFYTRF